MLNLNHVLHVLFDSYLHSVTSYLIIDICDGDYTSKRICEWDRVWCEEI